MGWPLEPLIGFVCASCAAVGIVWISVQIREQRRIVRAFVAAGGEGAMGREVKLAKVCGRVRDMYYRD